MAYSVEAVANFFIKEAKEKKIIDLTPMKLQKLIFYAQSWYLKGKDTPLLLETFSRWKYGPVIPELYYKLKHNQAERVTEYLLDEERKKIPYIPKSDEYTQKFLQKILDVYGPFSGIKLSALTHEKNTAWSLHDSEGDGSPITWDEMKNNIHPANRFKPTRVEQN